VTTPPKAALTNAGSMSVFSPNADGFVKSPSAVLRLIPQDLRALHLELFALPSI
jgi:hypothetical protein